MLINWILQLPKVFQFIGSEVYNIVDKTFPLSLLLKEGDVWFRGQSLLLHGISGSRLRPILDRSGGSAGGGRLMLLLVYDCFLASISSRSMCPSEKALKVRASGERSESVLLGKRFVVAKLTASLSPRAMLRSRQLVTSRRLFRHPRSKSAPAKIY